MSNKSFVPVLHLEIGDFNKDGSLNNNFLDSKLVILLVQYSQCAHCEKLKPIYENLANYYFEKNDEIVFATVVLDSSIKTERQVSTIINKIVPNIESVPSFAIYDDGKLISNDEPENYDWFFLNKYVEKFLKNKIK